VSSDLDAEHRLSETRTSQLKGERVRKNSTGEAQEGDLVTKEKRRGKKAVKVFPSKVGGANEEG